MVINFMVGMTLLNLSVFSTQCPLNFHILFKRYCFWKRQVHEVCIYIYMYLHLYLLYIDILHSTYKLTFVYSYIPIFTNFYIYPFSTKSPCWFWVGGCIGPFGSTDWGWMIVWRQPIPRWRSCELRWVGTVGLTGWKETQLSSPWSEEKP